MLIKNQVAYLLAKVNLTLRFTDQKALKFSNRKWRRHSLPWTNRITPICMSVHSMGSSMFGSLFYFNFSLTKQRKEMSLVKTRFDSNKNIIPQLRLKGDVS